MTTAPPLATAWPRPSRIVLAFIGAPLAAVGVPALLVGLATLPGGIGPTLAVVIIGSLFGGALAFALTVLVALPAYLLLRGRVPFGSGACAAAGAATTVLPCFASTALGQPLDGTFALLLIAALPIGLFGGAVFWLIATWGDPRFNWRGSGRQGGGTGGGQPP